MSNTGHASSSPPPGTPSVSASLVLPNNPALIEQAQDAVVTHMERFGYSKASRFAVRLALAEAIANAFNHGHKTLPGDVPIALSYTLSAHEVRIVVRDQGPGFKPDKVPDPTLDENLEIPSGRGIMLIRAYMTDVAFNPAGNEVTMVYRQPSEVA